MFRFLTYLWIFAVVVIVIAVSITLSLFAFIIGLILLAITIPYFLYIRWKAKKELEELEKDFIDVEYEVEEPKKLKDKF